MNYRVYDGEHLPFAEGTFDVAFTVCVMHHIEPGQWRSFAGEMHRVVRRGGMALVFEHNPRNPLTLRAVNNCPFDEDAVLLRSETTAGLLSDVGLGKVDTRFILSVPAAGWLMQTLDRGFSRLPWGAQYYIRAENLNAVARRQPLAVEALALLSGWRPCDADDCVSTNVLAMSSSVSPQLASICGYAMGMLVSFFGQSRLTFTVGSNSWGQVCRFAVLSIGGFLFSWGGIYLSVEWLGVSVLWGSLATSAIIPATNFVVMNFWVFSED